MVTFLNITGSLVFVIFNVCFPFNTLYEYRRSPHHPRRALIGSGVMLLLALLAVLNWIMEVTHFLTIKDPSLVGIAFLDLTLLVYGWTSPGEKWVKRRNNRKILFVMPGISVFLVTVCVIIFAQV